MTSALLPIYDRDITLVKGAAGQAVQNLNLASGLPETMGLVVAEVA